MKKVYLSILGITALTSSFAQMPVKSQQIAPKKSFATEVQEGKQGVVTTEKAAGTLVWGSDFSTPGDWTIDNDGQSGATFGWNIDATESSWAFSSVINSVSDGNFAEMNNGNPTANPATQALDVVYTLTTANAIPITTNAMNLSFLQYGARFNDAQEVYVSEDGTSWTKVGDNSDQPVLSASGGAAYANPTTKTINLSGTVSPSATQLWIRFSWTTAFPSSASNPNVWVTYGWMIDDVALTTLPDNDLKLLTPMMSMGSQQLSYYKIPVNQVSDVTFLGSILNNGADDQTNSNLEVSVAGGSTYVGTPSTIVVGDTTDYTTDLFTPAATIGTTYTYTFTAVSDLTEDAPSDNTAEGSFMITDSEYRVDNGESSGSISNVSSEPEGALKIGNLMEIMADDKIDSMYVTLGSQSTNVGQEFYGEIWKYDGTTWNQLAQTDFVQITSGNNNTTVKVALQSITEVYAGDLLLVMAAHNGGANSVDFAMAQTLPTGYVLGMTSGGTPDDMFNLTDPGAIMVGLNLNENAGIKETISSVSVSNMFPNPTSGTTTLAYTLNNASEVSVKVVDVLGKVVYSVNEGTKVAGKYTTTIDASAFNTGVYYVTVSTANGQVTKKLIKK